MRVSSDEKRSALTRIDLKVAYRRVSFLRPFGWAPAGCIYFTQKWSPHLCRSSYSPRRSKTESGTPPLRPGRHGITAVDGNQFGNAPESQQYLVEGGLTYIGDLHNLFSGIWAAGLKTAESIRTGTPVEKHDFSRMAPEHLEGFFRALHFEALGIGCQLAERPEFTSYRSLLDVGGGSGGVGISLVESLPHVNATIVDLPEILPIIKRYISETGVSDRVSTLANDVTRDPIDGEYDAAIMKSFIQTLSQEQANQAVRNVAAALKSGGRLFIMGNGILDDSRVSPPDTATFNIGFLGVYDEGRAYTEGEYRSIVEQAGLVEFAREIDTDGDSLITARKPS